MNWFVQLLKSSTDRIQKHAMQLQYSSSQTTPKKPKRHRPSPKIQRTYAREKKRKEYRIQTHLRRKKMNNKKRKPNLETLKDAMRTLSSSHSCDHSQTQSHTYTGNPASVSSHPQHTHSLYSFHQLPSRPRSTSKHDSSAHAP